MSVVSDEHGSDDEYVDELPDDLNAAEFVGPYLFPNNSRRRVPGILYILIGAAAVVLWLVRDDDAVLVNGGLALAGVGLVVLGVYHLQAGWDLAVDEQDALAAAARAVGFPVGHASAQMAWRGLRSRPPWRLAAYPLEELSLDCLYVRLGMFRLESPPPPRAG